MKIWLISQDERQGYDTYDSAVVIAETEEEARMMSPCVRFSFGPDDTEFYDFTGCVREWASSPDKVTVKYLGEADSALPKGSVCGSCSNG